MSARLIQLELERIMSLVSHESTVERVFLFGSAVDEVRLHDGSDIDLCIVQRTTRRFYGRLAEWIDRIQPEVGLDLVVYTPREFEEMQRNSHFVRSDITEKGKEIYHAA